MPQQQFGRSYVDTDVREVFENHTVDEARDIHRKINYEIERKREELRMLVGERYRDLIDAADTIGTMRISSLNISEKLHMLRAEFNGLSSELTIPVEKSSADQRRGKKLTEEELEASLGLKLSLDIPGAVQNFLEKDEVIPAVHIALLFSKWLVPNEQKFKWTFLHATRGTLMDSSSVILHNICEYCDTQLNAVDTSDQMLAECIQAKHILIQTSVDKILSGWLSAKVESCRQALGMNSDDVLSMVTSSLKAVYSIFIDPNLYNNTTRTIQSYKIDPATFGLRLKPKLIVDYNNSKLLISESLHADTLSEIVLKDFIVPLKNILQEDEKYLSQFRSLSQLQEYRQKSLKLFKCSEDLIRIILGPSTSLWMHVFDSVFQRRAEAIVNVAVNEIIVFLRTTGYPKFRTTDENFDMVGYVWKPSPVTNTDTAAADDNLKRKCITPSLSQLFDDLEFHLSELLVDFQTLGDQSVKEFLSASVLQSFQTYLLSLVENTEESNPEKSNSAFGRFTIGLLDLCPTLWKLLETNDRNKLKQDLSSFSEKCWENWNQLLVGKFNLQLTNGMGSLSPVSVTSFMPMGEVYEAETGENGENFVPSVRVPVELTYTLHSSLFSICLELSKMGPQCIPKTMKDSLRVTLAKNIISFYEKLSELEAEEGRQPITPQMALQFVFDLKFIQWLHSSLRGTADSVILKLKDLIDPFDWDIINTRMTSNLKRFLFENHLTLGLLFSEESHGFIAQNFKTKQSLNFPAPTKNLLYNQLPLLPLSKSF